MLKFTLFIYTTLFYFKFKKCKLLGIGKCNMHYKLNTNTGMCQFMWNFSFVITYLSKYSFMTSFNTTLLLKSQQKNMILEFH